MQNKFTKNNQKLIKSIGEIVKAHRKSLNKTIYKISAECSVSKSTWRDIELANNKNITINTLWKIADGLDMPLWKLIQELQEKLGKDFILDENEF